MSDEEFDESGAFFSRRTDKSIISKRFPSGPLKTPMRYMSKIVENEEGLKFVKIQDEIVLHRTPAARHEIKATILEDSRGITSLTIQKFLPDRPHEKQHFWFGPSQITALLEFVAGMRTVPLPNEQGRHVTDEEMRAIILDRSQLRQILIGQADQIADALKSEDFARDIVAVGYRRAQLTRFEKLLTDASFFEDESKRIGKNGESLWQSFFEANKWIFGYGLAYQFLGNLDHKKLEQEVAG